MTQQHLTEEKQILTQPVKPKVLGKLSQQKSSIREDIGTRPWISRLLSLLSSPWVLLTVPLFLGGMWLVQHPSVIVNNLNKPYALLAGPALVGSILAGWMIVTFFRTIASWCRESWQAFLAWKRSDGSTFWMVIAIFLAVSVTESGNYFNGLLGSNDLFGTLGFASAFVIDLVAVECMRARLSAARIRDTVGMQLYLFGVIACAGLSAFANTYTALEHFAEPSHTLLPWLMIKAAPWTGMAFPLLIIFLSFTADYTADQTSSKLDPENYEKQESIRVRLRSIQRDKLRERVTIDQEIDALQILLSGYKPRRTFFLIRLFFPVQEPNMAQLLEQMKVHYQVLYAPTITTLKNQIVDLQKQLEISPPIPTLEGANVPSLPQPVPPLLQPVLTKKALDEDHRKNASPVLSLIESKMYELLLSAPQETIQELIPLAQSSSFDVLKQRYPSYQDYITSERIEHVLAAFQYEHPEWFTSPVQASRTIPTHLPSSLLDENPSTPLDFAASIPQFSLLDAQASSYPSSLLDAPLSNSSSSLLDAQGSSPVDAHPSSYASIPTSSPLDAQESTRSSNRLDAPSSSPVDAQPSSPVDAQPSSRMDASSSNASSNRLDIQASNDLSSRLGAPRSNPLDTPSSNASSNRLDAPQSKYPSSLLAENVIPSIQGTTNREGGTGRLKGKSQRLEQQEGNQERRTELQGGEPSESETKKMIEAACAKVLKETKGENVKKVIPHIKKHPEWTVDTLFVKAGISRGSAGLIKQAFTTAFERELDAWRREHASLAAPVSSPLSVFHEGSLMEIGGIEHPEKNDIPEAELPGNVENVSNLMLELPITPFPSGEADTSMVLDDQQEDVILPVDEQKPRITEKLTDLSATSGEQEDPLREAEFATIV